MEFFKQKRAKRRFDTSVDGYRFAGIKLTEKQLFELSFINQMMVDDKYEKIPVHYIIMVLKCLGVLPSELMCDVGDDKTADNTKNVGYDEFQRTYGKFTEEYKKSITTTSVNRKRNRV